MQTQLKSLLMNAQVRDKFYLNNFLARLKMEKLLLLLVVMAFAAVLILFIYLITRVSEIEQRAIHGEPADTVSTQLPRSGRE